MIMTDTQRLDMVSCYENSGISTPCLDALAREGIKFDKAYTTQPVCGPARSALFTGQYPCVNGSFANSLALGANVKTIGQRLSDRGIATGYIGKWHLDKPDGRGGWDAYTPPGKKRHGFDFWYSYGTYNDHLHPHYWDTEGNYIEVRKWSPEHETDVALDFLQCAAFFHAFFTN